MCKKTVRLSKRLKDFYGRYAATLYLSSNQSRAPTNNSKHPTVAADAQSSSVPRRLLCNRLEVLIHLTLLRVMWGAGSEGEETASKMKKKKKISDNQPVLLVTTGQLIKQHCADFRGFQNPPVQFYVCDSHSDSWSVSGTDTYKAVVNKKHTRYQTCNSDDDDNLWMKVTK